MELKILEIPIVTTQTAVQNLQFPPRWLLFQLAESHFNSEPVAGPVWMCLEKHTYKSQVRNCGGKEFVSLWVVRLVSFCCRFFFILLQSTALLADKSSTMVC